MTSIDDLFKKPSLPSKKRKVDSSSQSSELYKLSRLKAKDNLGSNEHLVAEDGDDEDDDVAAGPELPPDLEEEVLDDEEGRFFGGGITANSAEALDFIEGREKGDLMEPNKIDSVWLRKLAVNFEKKISRNAELRAKFEDIPEKFMGSEADLDAEIKTLSILSEHPILYVEFAQIGCVSSLVSLLSHENTDIAIDAIEIINELTDDDVEAEQDQWDSLVDAMLDSDVINLLHENLLRLDEDNESDRAGVYHILGVFENFSSRVSIAELMGTTIPIIRWLLKRIQRPEPSVSQNKQYSTEVLAILLQSTASNRAKLIESDGIDIMLQLLSSYRKRNPGKGTEEEEYVENLFNCVTCCADDREGKTKFLVAEGIELCLIMLREGKMSKPRALRLLDHALGGPDGAACCEKLVEAAGLKVIFSIFMKKHNIHTTEHVLGILSSMLRSLPSNSDARIRLLAKFVENEYEKLSRLVSIRREFSSKMSTIDNEIALERSNLSQEEQEERVDEWFSRKLDAGLFSLQTADVILAWMVAEDIGAKRQIEKLLSDRDETLQDLKKTLQEQLNIMDDAAATDDEDSDLKDMLKTLVQCL